MDKKASPVVYMMEELGDARMRTDQLKRHIADAVTLFNSLPTHQKEAVTEIAGHLVRSIPETLFLVNKALEATALAANRIDYEEIRKDLQPSKVEELERVLDEVRHVQPRLSNKREATSVSNKESKIHPSAINPRLRSSLQHVKTAEIALRSARATGIVANGVSDALLNIGEALRLLAPGVMSPTVSKLAKCAGEVKGFPWEEVEMPPAQFDTKLASEDHDHDYGDDEDEEEGQAKTAGMSLGHAGDFLLSANRDLRKADGIVKDYVITTRDSTFVTCHDDLLTAKLLVGKCLDRVIAKISNAETRRSASEGDDAKRSRFEEGVPADPTENMSPEDAAEWENNTEENKDNFKSAAADTARYESVLDSIEKSCKDIRHHLKKGEKTPWEDVSTLFNQIRSTSATMLLDKNASDDKTAARRVLRPGEEEVVSIIAITEGSPPDRTCKGFRVDAPGSGQAYHKTIESAIRDVAHKAPYAVQNIQLKGTVSLADAFLMQAALQPFKFDPDYPQQLALMTKNPPKVSTRDQGAVIEVFSPFVKKYIPMAEYTSAELAEKDLGVWLKAHRETLQNLRDAIKSEGKTAADDKLTKKDLVKGLLVVQKAHPEFGTWKLTGPAEGTDGMWEVKNSRGSHVEDENDLVKFYIKAPKKTAAGDEPTLSRFEEGEDADPTENMSEEDAKKWRLNTLIHKDKFTEGDKDSKKACLLKLNLK